MRKTETAAEFYCQNDPDEGLVSIEEILFKLSNPQGQLTSSSRGGKLTFQKSEIEPYLPTLLKL